MPKALRRCGAFHMNHYNLIHLLATTLGGIGMFCTLLMLKHVLIGPPLPLDVLLPRVFISGVLIGAALVLAHIAEGERKK